MTATLVFTCTICGEPSQTICAYCTKDACANHLCDRCKRCSDCCECEVRLQDEVVHPPVVSEAPPPSHEPVAAEQAATSVFAEPEVGPETADTEPPDLSKLFAPEPERPAPQPDLSALFVPEPPAAAPPPVATEPDLSKLFAPEPEAPPPPPDLSALFSPDPGQPSVPPADCDAAVLTSGEPDLSKLFAPEPPPKPKPPVFSKPEDEDHLEERDEEDSTES